MTAEPELISRTWMYRFTVPRAGWPLTVLPSLNPARPASRVQVREVIVHLAADEVSGPRVTTISARGRWVGSGKPAHATPWLRFRPGARVYEPGESAPPGPVTPWLDELAAVALAAAQAEAAIPAAPDGETGA